MFRTADAKRICYASGISAWDRNSICNPDNDPHNDPDSPVADPNPHANADAVEVSLVHSDADANLEQNALSDTLTNANTECYIHADSDNDVYAHPDGFRYLLAVSVGHADAVRYL